MTIEENVTFVLPSMTNMNRLLYPSEDLSKVASHEPADIAQVEFVVYEVMTRRVRKKITLLRCTENQVGTGHKLLIQLKNPAWAKLAAIKNKNGRGTAQVGYK